jgi:hypothetical protein
MFYGTVSFGPLCLSYGHFGEEIYGDLYVYNLMFNCSSARRHNLQRLNLALKGVYFIA